MTAFTDTFYQERVLAVLLHIQQHLDDELSLERLAKVAHFSPYHFHRIFRSLVGEGVAEHVRRLRLERAAVLLKYGEENILEIALGAGFESHEAFSRAFRATFGTSPRCFRKTEQDRVFAPSPCQVHYDPHGALAGFVPAPMPPTTLEVWTEQRESVRVAFMRGVGSFPELPFQVWDEMGAWMQAKGLDKDVSVAYGLSWDDPDVTPPGKCRYDAAIPVDPEVTAEGAVGIQELPGGTHLVTRYVGPIGGHVGHWETFINWVVRSAWHIGPQNVCFDVYRLDLDRETHRVVDLCIALEAS